MKSVIAFMLLWIGANTDYDVNLPHPQIVMLPQAQLEEVYGGSTRDDFNIHDPWKKSVLFHELFHYVQDQNDFKGQCVQEWEREVYPLQKKYLLEVHGLDWNYDELWYKLVSTCPTN